MSHVYSKIYKANRENMVPFESPHDLVVKLFLSAARQMEHSLEALSNQDIETLSQRTDRVIQILSGIIANLEKETPAQEKAAQKMEVMLDRLIDLVVRFSVHQDKILGQQLEQNFKSIAEAWKESAPSMPPQTIEEQSAQSA